MVATAIKAGRCSPTCLTKGYLGTNQAEESLGVVLTSKVRDARLWRFSRKLGRTCEVNERA